MSVEIRSKSQEWEAELADSVAAKSIGLRFRSEGKMLFPFRREKRPVIDGFLVRGKLNLYFLDSGKSVVEKAHLPPFTVYRPENSSRYLLESFEALPIDEGQRLEFEI